MFERIKKWYSMGLWTEEMVRNAVRKNIITSNEFEIIIGFNTVRN